jgi:beta-galactosidase
MNTIPPLWENPEIQCINRLPMRSGFLPFPSERDALADILAGPEFRRLTGNSLYLDLDGAWNFKLLNNPADDDLEWVKRDAPPEGTPDTIRVPGTWTLQGYDKPHYTNVQMPFQAAPPRAPQDNPTGLYRRDFTLPADWKNKRVVLHVGSAESCCLVYLDGVFVGMGKDTRLPSEYDLSPFLNGAGGSGGKHSLCLKVVRYSDASYVEDQDQWWFGGIHRSVYLYATEDRYLTDVEAIPGSPGREGEGRLRLLAAMGGRVPESCSAGNNAVELDPDYPPFVIKYRLYPYERPESREDSLRIAGTLKPLLSGELNLSCNYRINSNRVEKELILENPKIWSHESPSLYILTLDVYQGNERVESTALCTGFRSVSVARRELLINGKAVLIKGVNRHEHDEKTGKTLSTQAMLRDIALLKQHNFNAVRTCHYPDDERWYELCDRYGIYLVDEANIEHHCFYNQLCDEPAWTYAYTSRIQRMVERDKNHPSVIIWSLGNESGNGTNHSACGAWIRKRDPSRPVNYEGAVRPVGEGSFSLDSLNQGKDISDIISPMYPAISLITDFVKYREDHRPLIMIEYSHAMGNSNGSLADYWDAIETHHGLQGGFIWDWIDQGIEAHTPEGSKYWKYGGDFGDEPSDYDFCLNGLLFPDQSPKPAMAECRQVFAPVRMKGVPGKAWHFILENRFDFSSLSGTRLTWYLASDRGKLAEGTEDLPDIAPGASSEIVLRPGNFTPPEGNGILYLHWDFRRKEASPWAEADSVIAGGEAVLHESLPFPVEAQAKALAGTPTGAASGTITGAAASELAAGLDEFARLFSPSLFRAPTENDGLKTYIHLRGDPAALFYYKDKPMYPWLDLDLAHLRLGGEKREPLVFEGGPALRCTAELLAGDKAAKGFENTRLGTYLCLIAAATESRPLLMDISIDLDPALPELPKVGVRASVPGAFGEIRWFGEGPGESYPDRRRGVFTGEYRNRVSEMETPYVVPQENGNRSGVRRVTLVRDGAAGGPQNGGGLGKLRSVTIASDRPVNLGISRYTQDNLFAARHTCDLKDTFEGGRGCYFISLDMAQRGVGTATCGPDTLEKYRVRPGLFKLRLYISGEPV